MANILINVTQAMKDEASDYADLSRDYTSRNHDFHEGGPDNAKLKMYEGKIGEKAFRSWLDCEGIPYIEDNTPHDQADYYDFLINGFKIDVKTRTESYHTRTLELVNQFEERPKDIYVSTYYNRDTDNVELIGVISSAKLLSLNQIENHGYLDNYVAYDNQLGSMAAFKQYITTHKKHRT